MPSPKLYRAGLPPMPARISKLAVSDTGYPIPYFVQTVDGRPDFRVIDPFKMQHCVSGNRCHICGEELGAYKVFAAGPMLIVNRVSAEPPSHLDCAVFAAQACPFMLHPKATRRDAKLPAGATALPGVHVLQNPGMTVLLVTKRYDLIQDAGGVLFSAGQIEATYWYARGRAASREEAHRALHASVMRAGSYLSDAARLKMARAAAEAIPYLPPMEKEEAR